MDKQSLFFTCIVAVVATSLMIILIQFLAKRLKIKSESEQKITMSYSIWNISILISFFLLLKVSLELIENSIEIIIYSKTIENAFMAVMQKTVLFSGFTFFFTFLSYFIIDKITQLPFGNRIDSIEIEKENIGYFLIKGVLQIVFTFSLLSVFEHFLRWFMPSVETPFYH